MEDSDEMTEEGDGEGPSSPYCQSGRRRDPVYLASMTAHSLPTQAQVLAVLYFTCTVLYLESMTAHSMPTQAQVLVILY